MMVDMGDIVLINSKDMVPHPQVVMALNLNRVEGMVPQPPVVMAPHPLKVVMVEMDSSMGVVAVDGVGHNKVEALQH